MEWQHDTATLDAALKKAKGKLFLMPGAGFLGSLLCAHEIVWSKRNKTAWCNGKRIGINADFFMGLRPEARVSVLVHELWHTGFHHMSRVGDRDYRIWNRAGDFVINNDMDNSGFCMDFGDVKPCLDHQYDGMSTEQVYDLLVQNPEPTPANSFSGDLVPVEDPQDLQEITVKVVQAQTASKIQGDKPGTIPGEISLTIEEFLNPVLPWEILLMRFFTELSQDDYSWRRPSRRYEDEYLPSLSGENGLEHLIWFLDISGSISDEEITRFNSETKHVHEEFSPKKLTLVTFDTEIHDVYEFTDQDVFEKIEVTGRGGTDLTPVYEYIRKHQPTAAVVFSDMYCSPMHANPGCPIIWAVSGNPSAEVPFGKIIHIPPE